MRDNRWLVALCASAVGVLVLVACSGTLGAAQAPRDGGRAETDPVPPASVVLSRIPVADKYSESNTLAVSKAQDDVTLVTEYDLLPGVSARRFYATRYANSATRSGLHAVDVANSTCSYAYLGSATTLCPMLHWSNSGHANPQVYFVDHTGNRWPVYAATRSWNRTVGIDVLYTRGRCPAGAHCVQVWDGNYGDTCWEGKASWKYYRNGNFANNSVAIWLNDYTGTGICQGRRVSYYKSRAGYRQDICHEAGHTLGLDHNSAYDSCLYADITNSDSLLEPDRDDLALLGWLYSVPH